MRQSSLDGVHRLGCRRPRCAIRAVIRSGGRRRVPLTVLARLSLLLAVQAAEAKDLDVFISLDPISLDLSLWHRRSDVL